MKRVILSLVLVMLAGVARAADFSFIKLNAPVTAVGTFIKASDASVAPGGVVGIILHKQAGTDFLSSLASGWIPLTAGGTLGKGLGGPSVALGTGLNFVPAGKATLLGLIDSISSPNQLPGLKAALASGQSNVTMFMGVYESLVFQSLHRYGTCVTWFVGPSIAFN